ncbi:hypothetical protein DW352_08850 [Pseudolabrys taiwanensis]|uniref:Uncharacterized protein n=1 Tax=Pseudolabrys taiwanensis TaxID=331696 RepID=A0A345ZUL3_9HYPH|nr:hypothetical protein [Pseudolabrys taiwanensis]AXK80610.1 hypothetical protein DW352_08850 [Pseudolabrys taiwanensis]
MRGGTVVALSGAAFFLAGCAEPSLTRAMKQKYEMDLLRPASAIYIPGTLARVRVVSRGSDRNARVVSLSRFCRPGGALPLASITPSPTEVLNITYNVSADSSAKAELEAIAGIELSSEVVDKVDISLKNTKIYRPDDLQLKAAVSAIRRSGCSTSGRSLVTAVLQADVDVKTTFKIGGKVSASQKQAIGRVVSASFGANITSESGETSTGTGLFYGIEVDEGGR